MTIFYHVSTDVRHNGVFVPRIPDNRHQDAEDDTTLRVSVAPTIEECLTAIPGGGMHLEELNLENRGYYLIFRIDTEKLGIPKSNIVTSETLYERDLVRDAGFTNEHWITTSFVVPEEDKFLIRLDKWNEEPEDVLPHSIYEISDEKYDGDYLEAFIEEYGTHPPCASVIKNLIYTKETVVKGEEVTLYYEDDIEKDCILRTLEKEYNVQIRDVNTDEITFVMNQDANLQPLFMRHMEMAMLFI